MIASVGAGYYRGYGRRNYGYGWKPYRGYGYNRYG